MRTPNAATLDLNLLRALHVLLRERNVKAEAAVQKGFLDDTLEPLMHSAGPQAPLYFVDGCHPSYTGHPAHSWIRRGATVELKSNHGRSRIDINGALSWPDRTLVQRQEEKITSAAMTRLFEELCIRHPDAPTITVVLDNACYNRSRELKALARRRRGPCPSRLSAALCSQSQPDRALLALPEAQGAVNEAYSQFALFKQAFDSFFEHLDREQDAIARLITDRFHLIGHPDKGIPSAQGYTSGQIS